MTQSSTSTRKHSKAHASQLRQPAKHMQVSSGNRFYAEVIKQRLKERKAHDAPR
jgi:hypothetical protein